MQCPICNNDLIIVKSRLEFENDHTPDLPTEAYRCLDMACICKDCANYAGEDLSTPRVIVETVRHKEE